LIIQIDDSVNIGGIVGAFIGILVLFCCLAIIYVTVEKKRRKKQLEQNEQHDLKLPRNTSMAGQIYESVDNWMLKKKIQMKMRIQMKKKQQQKEENKSTNDVMQVINVNENLTFNGKGKQVKFNLDQSSVRDHDIDTHRDDNSVA
jgi:Mg2+/citrate symporter